MTFPMTLRQFFFQKNEKLTVKVSENMFACVSCWTVHHNSDTKKTVENIWMLRYNIYNWAQNGLFSPSFVQNVLMYHFY